MNATTLAPPAPLQVDSVGQRFGPKWVLRDCSFQLRPHAVTALIGPNGAGKSTLMSAAAGLLRPTVGRISIEGSPVTQSPSHPSLGYLAQDKPLYPGYRVREMLRMGRYLNTRWDKAHAEELIDAAGLDRSQKVGTLSGGQRTRLAIALVLARRPSVLLLDEPLADLDPLARLEVQQALMTEVADTGMTVLMSSHILGEVVDLCEDVLVMASGRIALSGEIDQVLATHRVLLGPGTSPGDLGFLPEGCIVEEQHVARRTTLLIDRPVGPLPKGWASTDPSLDEVIVGYLRSHSAPSPSSNGPAASDLALPTEPHGIGGVR